MFDRLRHVLGLDRFQPADEARDRDDALRSAQRATQLARRLREEKARRGALTLKLEVRSRGR